MKLKVISFNIRCCDDPDGHSIHERAPRLAVTTSPYDADVIGFQEFSPKWEEFIKKYYCDEYEFFHKYRGKDSPESQPILWKKDKFECLKEGYFWLSDTPEVESKGWDEVYDCHRLCIWAVLKEKESGKCFTFMNTHFGFGDKCQVDSANLIYEYSKKISDYPTFVTGDFNMRPYSKGYAAMTGHFTDVNTATVNDLSDTYHGYKLNTNNDYHIDYCFINEKITPITQQLITTTVDGKFPSDHYGLYFELDF